MKQFYMNKKFWKEIRDIIPHKKKWGRPRISAKKIMNALCYILRTGMQWKALPEKQFLVSASTVHRRFQEWVQDSVFLNFWKKLLKKYAKKNHTMMRWCAFDGSVSKAPLGGQGVGPSPVDRRKIGTKKHICVDQNGIVIGIAISGANKHDNTMLKKVFDSIPITLVENTIGAADMAYDAKKTRNFLKQKKIIPLIPYNRRRSKQPVPKVSSRHRWLVERTFSHLNSWRGIFIRWNKKLENYLAAIQIASVFYTLRHL